MKKNEKLKYGIVNNIMFLLKHMAKEYPLLVFFILLQATLAVFLPLLGIYMPKIAVDLVTSNAGMQEVLITLGVLALVMMVSMGLSDMAGSGKYIMHNSMRMYFMRILYYQSLDCDYVHIESAEGQRKYNKAFRSVDSGDWSGTSKMTVAMINIFVAVISFAIYSSIISMLSILVVLLLVSLSAINFFAMKRAQKYEYTFKDEEVTLEKKLDYIKWTTGDAKSGKDVRLYSMAGWFLTMRDTFLNLHTSLRKRINRRYFAAGTVNALTLFLRDGIAYGYLIWAVSTGEVSVGNFILYFGAITGFSGFVGTIVDGATEINDANLQMNDLRAFMDNTDSPIPKNPAKIESEKNHSIEFKNVCFSYNNGENAVLNNFNLKIAGGEKIALVGINGAGKTTIVKLLCGLYEVGSGEILINDINIKRFKKKDLFKLFGVVFQETCMLPFTIAENIAMKVTNETDIARAQACLEKVGLYTDVAKYPGGIHSHMTKAVEDGVVFSGGQEQKLLMSRALYKDAPILILDEPTAALDPIAESVTYQSFHELAIDKTAIYISHRLASTRFCDRVVFLKDGIVAESGTHEDLLKQGGDYAQMFKIQSHYYKSKEGTGDEV